MKINKILLKKFLKKQYGIKVKRIKEIPLGEMSYTAILNSEEKQFFLKIINMNKYGQGIAKGLNITLRVNFDLFSKAGIQNISYPIPTIKRKLKTKFMRNPLIIYEYISGRTEGNWKLNKKEAYNFGKLIGSVHKSINLVDVDGLNKENFNAPPHYEKCLINNLKRLENNNLLKKLISRSIIMNLLIKAKGLKNRLEKKDFVLCHGDAIGENMIVEKNEVFLIDWDGVGSNLREKDLWLHSNNNIQSILKGYKKSYGKFKLNKNALIFYMYDRLLEDLSEYLDKFLLDSDKHALKEIKEYILVSLKKLNSRKKQLTEIAENWNKKGKFLKK